MLESRNLQVYTKVNNMKRTIIIIIFSICALACGTMIWIDSSLLNAIATVLIGLITGVLSSTLVTLYFNSEEKKQKEGIKKSPSKISTKF